MKKKILWVFLSFLLVASLVLSSCVKEEVVEEEEEEEEEVVVEEEEEEEEEEVVVPPVDKPIYGGKVIHLLWGGEAVSADHAVDPSPAIEYTGPVIEHLIRGDFEKYGPRGTDECPFGAEGWPVRFSKGVVAESWEITPARDKLIFHIRPGIIWAAYGKEHVMEPRELTAEDVAWSLNRSIDGPGMGGWPKVEAGGWIESVYAEGDTVVLEAAEDQFVPLMSEMQHLTSGWVTGIYAPEVVAAGASEWKNLVGTGPFMFKKYVVGSYISYERNPHYWHKTTIDGVEYEIPFIDELVYPMIPDASTRIAALRTGKVDVWFTIPTMYGDTLAETCPELKQVYSSFACTDVLALRLDRPPFDNPEVRRAMMIALDLRAVARASHSPWEIPDWPVHSSSPAFTPPDERPAHIRELYDYDPVKARQILADAGYPDGFMAGEIIVESVGPAMDLVSMVIAYWDEIGVEATMRPMEYGAYAAAVDTRDYDITHMDPATRSALGVLGGYFIPDNLAFYDNPEFTELYEEAEAAIFDPAKQNLLLKELALTAHDSVAYIPFTTGIPKLIIAWWPWLRNYYGECTVQIWNPSYAMATLWIDEDLKAELGY